MSENSKIEWTDHTFNPWWGCEKVSPACAHCYAETWAKRCGADVWGKEKARRFFGEKHWREPLKWNEATADTRQKVFCASMADVFEDRPELLPEREKLWHLIEETKNLDWLLLTKRPGNVPDMVPFEWMMNGFPANVWMGTTVEDQARADERVPLLLKIPAKVRFLSCEPLLGPVDLSMAFELWDECGNCGANFDFEVGRVDVCPECKVGLCMRTGYGAALREEHSNAGGRVEVPDGPWIHWVICGGESGPKARPMHPDWVRDLRDQCAQVAVPFLFKQWGEWVSVSEAGGTLATVVRAGKKKAGRRLDGRLWDEMPR